MNGKGKSVFISYAHDDIHRVRTIVDTLKVFQFTPWFDDHLVVGTNWRDELAKSIQKCDVFLYALSPKSQISTYCQWEYNYAVSNHKYIVPVVIESIDFENLPDEIASIARIQAADFTKGPKEIATAKMLEGINSCDTIPYRSVPWIELPPERPERYKEPDPNEISQVQKIYEKARSADVGTSEAIEMLYHCLEIYPYHEKAQRLLAQLELKQAIPQEVNPLSQPLEWITIPGGKLWIEDDAPPYMFRLKDVAFFEISKYPITDRQYLDFLNADDGYVNTTCWEYSQAAKDWRQEGARVARRSKFKGDYLPRINISWFDAVAFCQWLSLKTGEYITLPTPLQWQRAARGDTKNNYPWGADWNWRYCNSSVRNSSNGTSPVSQYDNGASPFGVMDMCGNVWEWTHLEDDNKGIILDGNETRWLYGGSWRTKDENRLRIDSYLHPVPQDSTDDIGFRVVRLKK